MKEKTATFIGHRQCTGLNTENLRNEIEGLVQKGVCNFLNRRHGVIRLDLCPNCP